MPSRLPSHVIDFTNPELLPEERDVTDPAIVDAPYHSRTWRHFANKAGNAGAGIWEATVHLERCESIDDELCHILEGQVRLTDSEGCSKTFGPGDSFVVGAGFKGTWENLTTVRKLYFSLR